jgi:hypothetical protein
LGIDTIVLQHEVGSYDAVTEILDARTNSIDHLCSINTISNKINSSFDEFPKIFFLEDGIIFSYETESAGVVGVHTPIKIDIKTGKMNLKVLD